MGLILDGSGFVCRCEVFSGNVCAGTMLEEMLRCLEAPKEALVVMDRGVVSEANLNIDVNSATCGTQCGLFEQMSNAQFKKT